MSYKTENTHHEALLNYVENRPKQGVIDTCEFSGLAIVFYIKEQEIGVVPGAFLSDISWEDRYNYELITKIDNIIDYIMSEEHQSGELARLHEIFAEEIEQAL